MNIILGWSFSLAIYLNNEKPCAITYRDVWNNVNENFASNSKFNFLCGYGKKYVAGWMSVRLFVLIDVCVKVCMCVFACVCVCVWVFACIYMCVCN